MLKKLVSVFSFGIFFHLIPSFAQACAVCFGDPGSNMARGFYWGIWVLLLLPFALIAIIATMIVRAAKKSKNHVNISSI